MNITDRRTVAITIERMKKEDLSEVLAIERASFPDPWSRTLFEQELAYERSRAYVARDKESAYEPIAGYGCLRWSGEHAEIMNLAVRESYRCMTIGRRLLEHLMVTAKKVSAVAVFLEVRHDNYPALELYGKYGFIVQRMRKGYYRTKGADAIEMKYSL